jgi:tetraacyldisaccharide 4'-kinase
VVLTRCDAAGADIVRGIEDEIRTLVPGAPVAKTIHAPLELLSGSAREGTEALRGRRVGAFCGIGNPDAFRATLTSLGADVRDFRSYPDHHPYTRADVDDLRAWAIGLPADAWVVTTQKDWVKLRITDLGGRPLWAVRVGLQFVEGGAEFNVAVLNAAGVDFHRQ